MKHGTLKEKIKKKIFVIKYLEIIEVALLQQKLILKQYLGITRCHGSSGAHGKKESILEGYVEGCPKEEAGLFLHGNTP